MKVLVIGGSGFIGPNVVRELAAKSHEVTVFHRGLANPDLPEAVKQMLGNRNDLARHRNEFAQLAPDVVIDVILSSSGQARSLMDTFRGIASRIVAISSQDVYRAYGVLLGRDSGPLQEVPITEDSDVRGYPPVSPEHAQQLKSVFSWVDDEYDKVPVERVIMNDAELPGTVLRLPMVYGPGDPLHRLFPIVKRVDDGRKTLLLDETVANWIPPRGYVEDVAHGIVLAVESPKAAGRIYNIAEEQNLTEEEWTTRVANSAGWKGATQVLPSEKIPAHLRMPFNTRQQWIVSSARIRNELGYQEVVTAEEALKRTIAWERANPPAFTPAQFDYAAEDAVLV
jgi:nucleoside-diphosphate-sugar epimerase